MSVILAMPLPPAMSDVTLCFTTTHDLTRVPVPLLNQVAYTVGLSAADRKILPVGHGEVRVQRRNPKNCAHVTGNGNKFSQNASVCSISCYLVSIAMSGKMKANPGSGRIWNLLPTSKRRSSLKSADLFSRTSQTILRTISDTLQPRPPGIPVRIPGNSRESGIPKILGGNSREFS